MAAAVASSASFNTNKRPAPQIIEVSDDEEEPPKQSNAVVRDNASRLTNGVASEYVSRSTQAEREASFDRDVGTAIDEDSGSDSDSLTYDLLHGGEDSDGEPYEGEECMPDECNFYKRRLHELNITDFVKEYVGSGRVTAKKLLTAFGYRPPAFMEGCEDSAYWRILGKLMLEEMTKRQKLPQYNTMDDAVGLLQKSSKIMVITGAGISTNLGIPDFRSPESGFYSQMKKKGFDDPESVFDLLHFQEDPRIFYENSGATFAPPGKTSPTHGFIALLQQKDKLLRNYTQNIDNIEASAGITPDKLIQCHGSWATATCQKCGNKVDGREILQSVQAKVVAYCKLCEVNLRADTTSNKRKRVSNGDRRPSKYRKHDYDDDDDSSDEGQYDIPQPGVMKPDITFFKEALPKTFFDRFNGEDKGVVDLVIVIGTSMKVAPVSEIPMALPKHVPHIYISRGGCDHIDFDITLLGDCDVICGELARRAGWRFEHKLLPEGQKVKVTAAEERVATWDVKKAPGRRSASASASERGTPMSRIGTPMGGD